MRRWSLLLALGLLGMTQAGCLVWSPDPTVRMNQLLTISEQIRMTNVDLYRVSLMDQPSTLNPVRVSGVVGP